MRHSVASLLEVVYQYYPRNISSEDPRYAETPEHQRLVSARKKAGAEKAPWRSMLKRLADRFPGRDVLNHSLHLPTGNHGAAYRGALVLPEAPGEHSHVLDFFVGFLVPCYVVHSSRVVDDVEKEKDPNKATFHFFYEWTEEDELSDDPPVHPGVEVEAPGPPPRRMIRSFDFSPEELPYARAIAEDIETHWEHERMPPEVGNVIVPDVAPPGRLFGEATLYHCLLSEQL
jgi:hypothetical protein